MHPPPGQFNATAPDVRRIRMTSLGTGATQERFANAIGVPTATVRNWEQGRRVPTGPARVLLSLIAHDPGLVFDVLNGQREKPAA
jgi:putative transcriptional regulator